MSGDGCVGLCDAALVPHTGVSLSTVGCIVVPICIRVELSQSYLTMLVNLCIFKEMPDRCARGVPCAGAVVRVLMTHGDTRTHEKRIRRPRSYDNGDSLIGSRPRTPWRSQAPVQS